MTKRQEVFDESATSVTETDLDPSAACHPGESMAESMIIETSVRSNGMLLSTDSISEHRRVQLRQSTLKRPATSPV